MTAFFRCLTLAWILIILAACSIPGQSLPSVSLFEFDKFVHFALFAVLGGLWMPGTRGPVRRRMGKVLAGGLALAVLTEIYQGLLPFGRSPDPFDALANTLGLITAVVLFHRWHTRREAQRA